MNVSMCNSCKLFNKDLNYCAFSAYIGNTCPNWEDAMITPKPNNTPPMPEVRQVKSPNAKIVITTISELPEYCYDCPCHDGENNRCKADPCGRTSEYRPFWCPLKEELGDKHEMGFK